MPFRTYLNALYEKTLQFMWDKFSTKFELQPPLCSLRSPKWILMVVALLEIRILNSSARTFLRWKILSNFVHLVGNEKLRSLLVLSDKAVYYTKQSLQVIARYHEPAFPQLMCSQSPFVSAEICPIYRNSKRKKAMCREAVKPLIKRKRQNTNG